MVFNSLLKFAPAPTGGLVIRQVKEMGDTSESNAVLRGITQAVFVLQSCSPAPGTTGQISILVPGSSIPSESRFR